MKAELKPEELRATDLRIGNYVRRKSTGEEFAIDVMKIALIESDNHGKYEASFEPIELSEEWLLKAGFEEADDTVYAWSKFISLDKSDFYMQLGLRDDWQLYWNHVHLKYVHQLQNLWNALTGNELIFNHG